MKSAFVVSSAALAALAGQALGQPVIDGSRDTAFYGSTPLWVQNQPTGFGDNHSTGACDNNQIGTPTGVTTGIEFSIPLAAIGTTAANAANIKIAGFINGQGHDSLSNQVFANVGLPSTQTLGLGEPRALSFATFANNQYLTGVTIAGAAPTIDGTRDAAYGTAIFTQTARTSFGDNTTNPASIETSNGSEIDQVYAVINGETLFLFVTGNLATDFTKLDLFFDTNAAVGQNRLLGTNPNIDFDGLNRMGEFPEAAGNGLTFDAGFTADYFLGITNGGTPYALYVNYAQLRDVAAPGDAGVGYYLGSGTAASNGALTGGGGVGPAASIQATINNSNLAGVLGVCVPSGDANFANGSEIDGIYGKVLNGKLYLLVTGSIETNFNKLDLFFDVTSGGQNRMLGNNPDIDNPNGDVGGGLNRFGNDGSGNGLKFDADFSADYWIAVTNGGNPVQMYGNAAVLRTDGKLLTPNFAGSLDYGSYDGGPKGAVGSTYNPVTFTGNPTPRLDPQDGFTPNIFSNFAPRKSTANMMSVPAGSPVPTTGLPGLIKIAINNSNIGGVSSNTATPVSVTDAVNVTTGVELEIDLAELGWTSGPIKVAGFINSGNHGFISNQVIGGLPNAAGGTPAANLGDPRAADFSAIALVNGQPHYVTISAGGVTCYPNCDSSTQIPFLNVQDFSCFLSKYASGNPYANCDGSTQVPTLNVQDFSCFLQKYASGCSAP